MSLLLNHEETTVGHDRRSDTPAKGNLPPSLKVVGQSGPCGAAAPRISPIHWPIDFRPASDFLHLAPGRPGGAVGRYG